MMVSSIKFHAFKDLTLVQGTTFHFHGGVCPVLALIAFAPFVVPFLLCAAYLISGPIMTAVMMARNKKRAEIKGPESETAQEHEMQAEQPQSGTDN